MQVLAMISLRYSWSPLGAQWSPVLPLNSTIVHLVAMLNSLLAQAQSKAAQRTVAAVARHRPLRGPPPVDQAAFFLKENKPLPCTLDGSIVAGITSCSKMGFPQCQKNASFAAFLPCQIVLFGLISVRIPVSCT